MRSDDIRPRATPQETKYDLIGVIVHMGSFNGGHYIAYCRGGLEGQDWFKFDDSYVSSATPEQVQSSQAYCLVYRRQFEARSMPPGGPPYTCLSRQWLSKWKSLEDPGPVSSYELVCPHGALVPSPASGHRDAPLLAEVSSTSLETLCAHFGSVGPKWTSIERPDQCKLCLEEERQLEERRAEEDRAISELDSKAIESGEQWYLMESRWLLQWQDFRNGASRVPPGPITNHLLLLNPQSDIPRPNLFKGRHYRGVNRHVWKYLYERYGGGPEIVRPLINIYASPDPTVPNHAEERRTSPRKESSYRYYGSSD